MKYGLYAPQVVGQPSEKGLCLYPAQDAVDSQSKVFVMCCNATDAITADLCAKTVGLHIQSNFNPNKLFTLQMLQAALDEARTELDGSDGTSLAVLCYHRGGVMMATVGAMQVHHLRRSEGRVLFSSLATDDTVERCVKPAVTRTTDVKPDDDFFITADEWLSDDQLLGLVQVNATEDEQTEVNPACGLLVTVETVIAEAADPMQPNDEAFSKNNARLFPAKKRKPSSSKNNTGLVVGLILGAILLAAGGWYGYEYFLLKRGKAQPKPEPTKVVPDTTATDTVQAEPVDSDSVKVAEPQPSGNYYNDPVVMPYSDPGPYVEPAEVAEPKNEQPAAGVETPEPPDDDDFDDEPEEPVNTGGVPPPPNRRKNRNQPQPVPPPPSK